MEVLYVWYQNLLVTPCCFFNLSSKKKKNKKQKQSKTLSLKKKKRKIQFAVTLYGLVHMRPRFFTFKFMIKSNIMSSQNYILYR